jgi:hypothetical protein
VERRRVERGAAGVERERRRGVRAVHGHHLAQRRRRIRRRATEALAPVRPPAQLLERVQRPS